MTTVAFIESNTTGTGRILAEKALRRGHSVCFLSDHPERYPYLRELMLHPRQVDTSDLDAVCRCLRAQKDLVAVLSSSEYYLEIAARAARALGLPGADPEAIAACRDKWHAREHFEAAGVATPATFRVTSREQAREAWQGGPVVVKPVCGSGSLGVRLHRRLESYEEHIAELLAVTENERGLAVEPVALVQEFIGGTEFSVEMLGLDGDFKLFGITAKHLGPAPHFLEVGHDFPAPISGELAEAIERTTCAALEAVGMRFGPTHTELRLRDGEPAVLEINPRLAGGMIPVLIEQATGTDVLEAILDVFLGQPVSATPSRQRVASIAFLVPERAGRLESVALPADLPPGVAELFVKARPGDALVREGSFRDRIGHVIATGASAAESRALAESTRDAVVIEVDATAEVAGPSGENTGRLKRSLHPEALEIVRKPPTPGRRGWELEQLAAIDEAHLVMLREADLLAAEPVSAVLGAIREMRDVEFGSLASSVAPRGTYLLYEGELIERLGVEIGGVTHLGRSRNDINACLFRLRLREQFERVYRSLWSLRSTLVRRAAGATELAMPVYSQFQPGLPGTLAFYLLGVERALYRDQQALKQLLPALDTSPMGACAGGGSTFAIRPERTAELLGFSETCRSALDAVASRDLALRLLSTVAISGMHVTRLTQDLQIWTTQEAALIRLPDDLAGGSSMMPQKKNPYLLEMIKGRATRATGHWVNATATMQRTPFSNSVEVGTEAVVGLEDGLKDYDEAARLLALVVRGMEPDPERMTRSIDDGGVIAAAVADARVRDTGAPFRRVHHEVGAAVAEALDRGESVSAALEALLEESDRPSSPLEWAHRYEHGGGPGEATTHRALELADGELDTDAAWHRACLDRWSRADVERRQAVDALIGGSGGSELGGD